MKWENINHQRKGDLEREFNFARDVAVEIQLFKSMVYIYVDSALEK